MKITHATKIMALGLMAVLALPSALGVDPGESPTAPLAALCGTVSGTISEENGAPINDATIVAIPSTSGTALTLLGFAGDETGTDGKYSFQLTQGRWTVVVAQQGGNYQTATAALEFTCADKTLDFALAPTVATGNGARGLLALTLIEDVDGNNDDDNVSAPMAGIQVDVYVACPSVQTTTSRQGYVAKGTTDAAGKLSLVLPTTPARNFCISVQMSKDYIDSGAGNVRDGVFDRDALIKIDSATTTAMQLNFTKKLRTVELVVADFDVTDRNVGGAALTVMHPVYCPGGVKPATVWQRYDCTATSAPVTTTDDQAGKVRVTLPIDAGTSFQVKAAHGQYFTHVDPCTVTDSPRSSSTPGNTPATQNLLECVVQVGHVSKIVSGRIVKSGVPVPGASVTFDGVLNLDDRTITAGPDGRFAVNLRTDDFTVTATSGADAANECMTLNGSVDFDLGDIDLDQDEIVISGKVRDPVDGALLVGTTVRIVDPEHNACQVPAGAGGAFSLSVPRDTGYEVIAGDDADENYDFKAGKVTLALAELVGPTKDVGTLDLTRRDGKLRVTVREDAEPDRALAGATVTCGSTVTGYTATGTTAANGQVLFRVPFGTGYTCSSTEAAGELAPSPSSAPVEVIKDDSDVDTDDVSSVSLLMQRVIYTFTGKITDAISEEPIEGASVEIRNLSCAITGSPGCTVVALTAADGTYTIKLGYVSMSSQANTRLNAILLTASQIDYEPKAAVGAIGPDARAQAQVEGDQALIPNEGKAGESVDMDGDRIPDAAEPTICGVQSGSDPTDGSCVGDDYTPPA